MAANRFQSAPANYGGRITGLLPLVVPVVWLFQSAPANYGGRILKLSSDLLASAAFQSAPANYGGRIIIIATY